jgi:ESCRT-II complex subunit VPS22
MSSQRRKPVGLAALTSRTSTASTYATHGSTLRSAHLSALETQLSVFQSLLQNFSIQHSKQIKSNPTFRAEFARMCNAIGVDPLASNNKTAEGGNWWAQVLGKEVGDFYFELAVRVVEVCRRSRKIDGGLVAIDVVRERVLGVNGEKVSE